MDDPTKCRQLAIRDIRRILSRGDNYLKIIHGDNWKKAKRNLIETHDRLCEKERQRKIREIENNLPF